MQLCVYVCLSVLFPLLFPLFAKMLTFKQYKSHIIYIILKSMSSLKLCMWRHDNQGHTNRIYRTNFWGKDIDLKLVTYLIIICILYQYNMKNRYIHFYVFNHSNLFKNRIVKKSRKYKTRDSKEPASLT